MTQLIAVTLDHRDHYSHGNNRRILSHEAYHWGIIIMPEGKEQNCCSFDATDSSEIDPVTFRMTNPTMDWWFRFRENVDPASSPKLIGRVIIGQVPDHFSSTDLRDFFAKVPLPIKNMNPQQSCVTWAVNAVEALQTQGWAQEFELDQFKNRALSYADESLQGSGSTGPVVKYSSVESSD